MSNNIVVRVILALMLCAFCGCTSNSRNSNISSLYEVTVEFISDTGKTIRRVEITAYPGVPFAVQTQDEDGAHYHVNGTLKQIAGNSFRLDQFAIRSPLGSSFAGSLDLELGQEWRIRHVATIVRGGYGVRITRKNENSPIARDFSN